MKIGLLNSVQALVSSRDYCKMITRETMFSKMIVDIWEGGGRLEALGIERGGGRL